MKTSESIINYLKSHNQVTATELVDYLGITDRAVRKQLKNLLDNSQVTKVGKPPKVYYSIASLSGATKINQLDLERSIDATVRKTIDNNFIYITPRGTMYEGLPGFIYWCDERNLEVSKTASFYQETITKYDKYRNPDGLIDGTHKLKTTFKDMALDKVFYLDFYAIEIFGKTKLGQMLLFAKQSQNRKLINDLADYVKSPIEEVIQKYQIDGVGFIPPTVKRQLQLMRQLEKRLNLSIRTLSINKIKTPIAVPQKTLSKLEDRIVNAKETIAVEEHNTYNNILLIDDAIGSGSTLNETAKKIRQRGICRGQIVGLAITGSLKGFEIISEV